ncbi:MAG TPA: mersacidin/lichenicidin family type 2 lantibiotic [Pyrinomonadaceae bacterium]|nr:mersacidin/lichenicidin family type 2 lantibiotic [Pyrinomonadaceae bacterium]
MSTLDIVRAWKDDEYCESLSDTQRAALPQNPAGVVELSDDQLRAASGGLEENSTIILSITLPICPTFYMCSLTICLPYDIAAE